MLLVVAGIFVFGGMITQPIWKIQRSDQDLAQAAQLHHLPETYHLLNDGPMDINQLDHPFGLGLNAEGQLNAVVSGKEALYTYESAYSQAAALPNGVVIGNFLYQYPNHEQAVTAVKQYTNELAHSAVQENALTTPNQLQGDTFKIVGDEGDNVYWFVAVQDNVVYLTIANGFDEKPVYERFVSTINDLQ